MLVVHVPVVVLDRIVPVHVLVPLADEQDDADGHECRGAEVGEVPAVAEQWHRQERARKRRRREGRRFARAPSNRSAYASRRMLTP